jgi:hypothetical protein
MNMKRVWGSRTTSRGADLRRHSRKCSICHHPERASIEDDFLRWRQPHDIVHEYKLNHHSTIYRHARAVGLFRHRGDGLRSALDILIEKAEQAPASAASVIRAIRAYSCLTDDGRWVEPVRRIIYETREISNRESGIRK